MADGTTWQDNNQRRIDRAKAMTLEERIEYHSKGMTAVEVAWWASYEQFMAEAAGDMTSEAAKLANKCLRMYHQAKAFHLEADLMAAEATGAPVARDGSR